ncbi:acetylxylan esterase [Flavobacteriaceae bacterium]|nr:acetylxylan esterase [Flavobacteriaceae bacterium]
MLKVNLKKSVTLLILLVLISSVNVHAQWGYSNTSVSVIVAPDHDDWNYKIGENVDFTITVLKYGNPVKNAKVSYKVMPEKMEPKISEEKTLSKGIHTVKAGTMKVPGFLRCSVIAEVDGKIYTGTATAAFEPEKIQPTTTMPKDFVEFWDKAKVEASEIPMFPEMQLIPELSDKDVNTYHVNIRNYRANAKVYGVLSVPTKPGKHPAIIKVPGAGVWGHFMVQDEHVKKGVITFEIRIHGVSVINEDGGLYGDLWNGALWDYWNINLDNKDHYYYKRVYLGCVRAVDFVTSLDEYDGDNLAVYGGSQGGALSIVTAALDDRIKYLVCYYPAMSDLTGYLHGRAGGWPHLFDKTNAPLNNTPERIETSKYYDVVNFARLLKVPGFYGWGYNDAVCPPTSMFSAYNVITAPKILDIMPDEGHFSYNEQKEKANEWVLDKLMNN